MENGLWPLPSAKIPSDYQEIKPKTQVFMEHAEEIVTFFNHEFFPWGGLPYPYEHAKWGIRLAQRGKLAVAKKMARFQQATLDHHKKPLFSLFRQEKGRSFDELEEVNKQFFKTIGIEPETDYHFVDERLGIVFYRNCRQTVICLGSGCKSGMGAFLVNECGIVNFGPQLLPLGTCNGFGLAGRGRNIKNDATSLSYQCRLAAPNERKTGIDWLQDSGYCATWLESATIFENRQLKVISHLEGFRSCSDFLFTFFAQASTCVVAGSHKLTPRSLDRYRGPPQPVVLDEITLLPEQGFKSMEIIPLAGDESYWRADFLIAFSLQQDKFQVSLFS